MKQGLHSVVGKCVVTLTAALTLYFTSYSQLSAGTYVEGGITVGPMVFLGDLGGHFGRGTTFLKDYNMQTTKLSVGAFVAVYPAEWLGFRLNVTYGHLEGDDALINPKGGDEVTRLDRNLNFKSPLTEATLMAEFYPTVFLEDEATDVTGRLRPYAVAGIGVFHFNPQGSYINPNDNQVTWVNLRDLHTEGQGFTEFPDRKNYSLTQLNIPFGFGIKYYFSEKVNLSFEIIHRKTFTDYIDDVSTRYIDPTLFDKYLSAPQASIAKIIYNKSPLRGTSTSYGPGAKRGDPNQNDAYFTAGFKIGVRLGAGNEGRWNNSTRCPVLRF